MKIAKAIETWKQRARQLKMETYALYLAYKDPKDTLVRPVVRRPRGGVCLQPH